VLDKNDESKTYRIQIRSDFITRDPEEEDLMLQSNEKYEGNGIYKLCLSDFVGLWIKSDTGDVK
jgi:hypothetical protein